LESKKKKNSLANSSAAFNGVQVLPGNVFEHADIEDLRDISEARDLIVAGSTGEYLSVVEPEGFLGREKTLALHKRPLDLAVVNGRVDRAANILGSVRFWAYLMW
jgi:hypothetical protein